jgi:hypothetical protein
MKMVLYVVATVGLLAVLGMAAAGPAGLTDEQKTAIEKAVLETHDKILEAAQARDADKMFSFILEHDKGVIIQDGRLMNRQEALERTRQGYSGAQSLLYDFQRRYVNVLSPEIAVLMGAGTITVVTQSGETVTSDFANTTVFVLRENEWKVMHGHHSIPNPN